MKRKKKAAPKARKAAKSRKPKKRNRTDVALNDMAIWLLGTYV